jgi:hypothetical protein
LVSASESAYTLARDSFGWGPIVDELEKLYRFASDPETPCSRW